VLIFHGRRVCFARKPDCAGCSVNDVCPAAFDADHVGRKSPRDRIATPAKTPPKAKAKKATARQAARAPTRVRRPRHA
jgi:endonuclease-3